MYEIPSFTMSWEAHARWECLPGKGESAHVCEDTG